jgi:prepilin-type N-terminal cleavage/methylation domain-containing protein
MISTRSLRRSNQAQRKGFTLIELMLVIGIIAVLAGIIGSALDIPALLLNTRDTERKQQVKTLETALYQHLVDEWELVNETEIPEGDESNAKEICREGVSDPSCVNLDALVPTYLPTLPLDPAETNPNLSGYKVFKKAGRPRIVAAHVGVLPGAGSAPGNACGGTVQNPCVAAKVWNGNNGWTRMNGLWYVNVEGNYAYMGSFSDHAFIIADISDPTNPQLQSNVYRFDGEFSKLENAHGNFVVGNTAYVVGMGNDDALTIMDVTNKTDPVLLSEVWHNDGEFSKLDDAHQVFVLGNYAYVASQNSDSLTIMDITNPTDPVLQSEIFLDAEYTRFDGVSNVYVVGNIAYVTSLHGNALSVVDVTDKQNPSLISEVHHLGPGGFTKFDSPNAIEVRGNYAYITSYDSHSLTIVDVSNPANPTLVSAVWDEGPGGFTKMKWPEDLAVDDTYAYVASKGDSALTIIDISDPQNPTLMSEVYDGLGEFDKLNWAYSVDVEGNYVYLVSQVDNALTVIGVR